MGFDLFCQEIQQELEEELSKRISEIHTLENFLNLNESNQESDLSDIYRKSLLILLYSHFEGFCKKGLLLYVDYVNRLRVNIVDVKEGIAVSNLHRSFKKLADTRYTPVDLGKKSIKKDSFLQEFGRKREFMNQLEENLNKIVSIPDHVVDTESNLFSWVLKKLLYQLEIDFNIVDDFQVEINELVNKRNSYVHGDMLRLPSKTEYGKYRDKTLALMEKVSKAISESFSNKSFLKAENIS